MYWQAALTLLRAHYEWTDGKWAKVRTSWAKCWRCRGCEIISVRWLRAGEPCSEMGAAYQRELAMDGAAALARRGAP